MIDICIGIAGPLVVFAFILSSLCNAIRIGLLVERGTTTLTKRIVITMIDFRCLAVMVLLSQLAFPLCSTVSAAVAAIFPPPLGPMEQLYRWMLSLWSTVAAVWVLPLAPLVTRTRHVQAPRAPCLKVRLLRRSCFAP